MAPSVRVAVWGCGHGELDTVYDAIRAINARARDGRPIELLLCCGDFQAVRNPGDLEAMACPPKYRAMRTFHRYYSGAALAPVLTLFVGGNHEASNHLRELHYGGWVAPRIYYLGASGVVAFRGLRIGGVSGIFKGYDFRTGYHERAPFSDDAVRSVFHAREFDYHKLHQLGGGGGAATAGARPQRLDIVVSHDWPEGVYRHGDTGALLRRKPHFRDEVAAGALGNPASAELLAALRPRYWFAGHLHVKFAAVIPHAPPLPHPSGGGAGGGSGGSADGAPAAGAGGAREGSELVSSSSGGGDACYVTRFLALDKCLPGKDFLQVLDIPVVAAASGGAAEHGPGVAGLAVAAEPLGSFSVASEPHAATRDATEAGAGGDGTGSSSSSSSSSSSNAGDGGGAIAGVAVGAAARDDAAAMRGGHQLGGAAGDPLCAGLCYDPAWLAVTIKTHAYTPVGHRYPPLPRPAPITADEVARVLGRLSGALAPAAATARAAAALSGVAGSVEEAGDSASLSSAAGSVEGAAAAAAACPAPPPLQHAQSLGPAGAPLLSIPLNFVPTVRAWQPTHAGAESAPPPRVAQPGQAGNPQTDALLALLGLPHAGGGLTVPCQQPGRGRWGGPAGPHAGSGGAAGDGACDLGDGGGAPCLQQQSLAAAVDPSEIDIEA